MIRVLVTGAGSPTAVAVLQAAAQPGVELYAADTDPWASGLFLVPPSHRIHLAADDAQAVIAACARLRVAALIPTLPGHMMALALARPTLEAGGTRLMLPGPRALEPCLDRDAGARALAKAVPTPRTEVFGASFDPTTWHGPVALRPRRMGAMGATTLLRSPEDLALHPRSAEWVVQEYLPGAAHAVDLLIDGRGTARASIPRTRLRGPSGHSSVQRVLRSRRLELLAKAVARRLDLRFAATIRLKEDAYGRARVLDVWPTFSPELALTVAAGVDLPSLALKAIFDLPIEPEEVKFRELAMMARPAPLFVDPRQLTARCHIS